MGKEVNDIIYNKLEGVSKISMVNVGESSADVYMIETYKDLNYYLKVQEKKFGNKELINELNAITWLKDFAITPQVEFFLESEHFEYLCISEVIGQNFNIAKEKLTIDKSVTLYAKSLKSLHAINIDDCSIHHELAIKLPEAVYQIENDLVNPKDFEDEYKLYGPKELYAYMMTMLPTEEELVYTHGDYCFDNLIYRPKMLLGFIDLGNGGIADKYHDIAIALRSIKHSFGLEYVHVFLQAYGLEAIDDQKIEFYTILDEFF